MDYRSEEDLRDELLGMYRRTVGDLDRQLLEVRGALQAAKTRIGYLENTPSDELVEARDHIQMLERQVEALKYEINEGIPTPESEKLKKELEHCRVLLSQAAADRDAWAQKHDELEHRLHQRKFNLKAADVEDGEVVE